MHKRFKYDYNNKMFIVCFLSSLLFLSIFIWSFNKNIIGCIAAGLCTIILLFDTFVIFLNQGITVGKKNILVIDFFWFTKINIKDLKYAEIKEIKKEKKGNLYGFFHEFYHPSTYMWKCDYVYNNGRVFKVIFHLKDGTIRETYFGWMYKERSILKVKKTIKKLEKCINYINLISKNKYYENNMNGKFYKKSCDKMIKTIKYDLNKDSTLFSVYNMGNYELLLGNGYHISIGIDKSSGECLSVCCLLDALPFKKIKMDFLNDTYKQYDLIYKSDLLFQGSSEHYTPFERKCYYDAEKSILAFGDIYNEGEIISLNSSTFAKLKNHELLAVFIKVSDDVIHYVERKCKKYK